MHAKSALSGNFIESSESIKRSLKIQGALGCQGEQMRSGLRAAISSLRSRYSESNWISTDTPKSHTASNMSKISSGLIIHSEWAVMVSVSSAPHASLICYFEYITYSIWAELSFPLIIWSLLFCNRKLCYFDGYFGKACLIMEKEQRFSCVLQKSWNVSFVLPPTGLFIKKCISLQLIWIQCAVMIHEW